MTATLQRSWTLVDDLRIHVRHALDHAPPARPPLVLVHGVAVSSRNMAPSAVAFGQHVPVYAPDLPNHGSSDDADHVLGPEELADALADWMRAVGLGSANLLGNSFGCQIAAEVAVRQPGLVDRLVLQGPTTDPHARSYPRQIGRWIRNGRLEGATQSDVTIKDWQDAGLKVLLGTFRHCVRHRIERVLPHVRCPTLVVRGELDPIVPQRWAEEATSLLKDGRLVVVPGASHTITNTRPDELAERAVPFLVDG